MPATRAREVQNNTPLSDNIPKEHNHGGIPGNKRTTPVHRNTTAMDDAMQAQSQQVQARLVPKAGPASQRALKIPPI